MGSLERRNSMILSEVSQYWRELRYGCAEPSQNKLCNSIATIDLAFSSSASALSKHLSRDKWARIRTDLFDVLVSSFPGHFLVYQADGTEAFEPQGDWPDDGLIEFFPKRSNRKSDVAREDIKKVHPAIVLSLRWSWADGRNAIDSSDFESYRDAKATDSSEEAQIAREFLDRICDICADEAEKSTRIAHRKWWRLSSEASSCPDKRTKNQLKKEMMDLENVWGVPTS
ncbi:MAG: hypothetical protein K2X93_03885 [Candidatus Obscuribacterales bacterium]|nr:hypothetical protein [Candidatus Obscuribacterales bacterium]